MATSSLDSNKYSVIFVHVGVHSEREVLVSMIFMTPDDEVGDPHLL